MIFMIYIPQKARSPPGHHQRCQALRFQARCRAKASVPAAPEQQLAARQMPSQAAYEDRHRM